MAAALATGWLVRAAYADSNPAATSGTGAPSSGESTATEPAQSTPPGGGAATSSAAGPFGYLSPSWQGQNLLGDMWGLRPALGKYGVTLGILENVETFGNLTGGVQQGFEANGLTTVTLQMDTQKAFGLSGGLFNVSGLQIWGGNLTTNNLLVLQTLTDIEAPVGVRLWELWYQQKFGDKFDLKIGEQSLDEEFIISPSANSSSSTACPAGRRFPRSICPAAAPPIRLLAWAFADGRS